MRNISMSKAIKSSHRTNPIFLSFLIFALYSTTSNANGIEIQGRCAVVDTAHNSVSSDQTPLDLRILANDFPALHALTDSMQACAPENVNIIAQHTREYRQLQIPALQQTPAAFDMVMTGNNAIVPLLNEGLLQPLDDLLNQFAPNLSDTQKVRFNGQTMAVAFLANAQHLFYRQDLLEEAGLNPPETINDILSACTTLKKAGVEHPFAASFKAGWDLGLEFINFYIGNGGEFSTNNSDSLIEIDTSVAKKALDNIKSLSECMTPDFLSRGINEVQASWQGGNHAIATLWGSRATAILDDDTTLETVRQSTRLGGGLKTNTKTGDSIGVASTLWWVGFALPKTVSPDNANAVMKLLFNKTMTHVVEKHNNKAVWLINGYQPDKNAVGVNATVNDKATAYPSNATINLLHEAAGQELTDFLKGNENADVALLDLLASYRSKAVAAGFSK